MFSFLRRLFTGGSQDRSGNKATSRRTPLREFIEDNCSLQTANRAFTSTADKREGFAASLSVLVFSVVKDMAAGVTDIPEMQREMTLDKGWEAYDILAFELTAWTHAYLLKVHKRESGRGEYDDEDDDPYDDCLMKSVLYSQRFLQDFCKKTQPEDLFANRVINYLMVKNAVETVMQRLVWSLATGEPQGRLGSSLGSLFLTVSMTGLVASSAELLKTVSDSAKKFYESEVEE